MHDVIVVGAGPSGSFCAYHLAKAGLSVLIAEKDEFPRTKLCGGGISHKTVSLIDGVVDFPRIGATLVTGAYLAFRNEHLTYVPATAVSYSLGRAEFDQAILKAAMASGCELAMPAEVVDVAETQSGIRVVTKDGQRMASRYLVLAEGINGRLCRKLGYAGAREITMALEVDVVPARHARGFQSSILIDFGAIPGGYAWVFPKNGHYNVGAFWHRSSSLSQNQRHLIDCFIRQFDWGTNAHVGKLQGHALPYKIDYAKFNTGRTVLVGDSAGAVDNFYGEGLYYGIHSGLLAAESIQQAISGKDSLSCYTRRLRSEILSQTRVSRLAARFFYHHPRLGYHWMLKSQRINEVYARVVHGGVSHHHAMIRALLLSPVAFAGRLAEADFHDAGLIAAGLDRQFDAENGALLGR